MGYQDTARQLNAYRGQIAGIRAEMRKLQSAVEPQPVEDYRLATTAGEVRLSGLFGDKQDLIVVHNMGTSCAYCTLWADGFNGVYRHLASRAAFVVTSPNAPDVQRQFAESRGWIFPMASHAGSSFAADMGYRSETGWLPGLSVFQRRKGVVVRVSDQRMEPGDAFCSIWHFLDLLPEGAAGWQPQFRYG
jgi:predicted dithiol-disulfide oxidoreductase (DUF899 family)